MRTTVPVDVDISKDDEQALRAALGVPATAPAGEFERRLQGLLQVAVDEHLDQVCGREDLAGKIDTRQRRLVRYVDRVFDGAMPPASAVSVLFRIPVRSAATLINTTYARFRQLDAARRRRAVSVLEAAVQLTANTDDQIGEYATVITDASTVEYLRDLLAAADRELPVLERDRDKANRYLFKDQALEWWSMQLGLDVVALRKRAATNAKR